MVYVAHPAAGVHRISDEWLEGSAASGFGLATVPEVAARHPERGLCSAAAGDHYCPSCMRRIAHDAAERKLHVEACASGPLEMWLYHCPACKTALAAELTGGASGGD